MKFVLTITTDYVKEWGRWEAVRELLQNAIDQSRCEGEMYVKNENERLVIGNKSGNLERKSLLLGSTSKGPSDIGQFGEGYKLALLVLCRLGHEVTIRNGKELWVPYIEYNEDFKAEVLCIEISEFDYEPGVEIRINNLSTDIYKDKYLPDIENNIILKDRPGDVFVEGLFVCHVGDMHEGYNFSSDRVTLNRDRGMVSTFDLKYEAARLWSNRPVTQQYELLERNYPYTEYMYLSEKGEEELLQVYRAKHGEAVPVSNQSELEEMVEQGIKFQLVPDKLRRILLSVGKFIFRYTDLPLVRLAKFQEKYSYMLSTEAKEYLDGIVKELSK